MDLTKKILLGMVAIVLVSGVVYSQRINSENKNLKKQVEELKNPQEMAKKEAADLVSKISKLVVLPSGEEPVVATVTDKEKLKDQPVFSKTENGDKILIYSNAKKAYIYRPDKNVVVDVIPVNMGENKIAISGVDANNPIKVALVNGTTTANLAGELEKRILDKKVEGLKVVSKASGKMTNYAKTLVIDLTGKYQKQVEEIAKLVEGEVATTSAETKPAGDVMVIIGANFK